MSKYEYVNHPTHYNHTGRKECWDEWVDKYGLDTAVIICLGNADKYLYRAGTKKDNSTTQDIAKAHMYVNKAKALITDNQMALTARTRGMYEKVTKELSKYDQV